MGATGMTLLIGGLICAILVAGTAVGTTLYRTLVYLPAFTAGVATILLWKALMRPHNGPINNLLTPLLSILADTVNSVPPFVVQAVGWIMAALLLVTLVKGLQMTLKFWRDGELGVTAAI